MPNMVGLAEIAKRLKLEVTAIRRFVARQSEALELELHRGKGDKILLSHDDADRVVAAYEARRGPIPTSGQDTAKFDRYGYFYIIQLVPEALPTRVKIGFAENVDQRLNEHRTAAPTSKLLKAWPCKRSWDYAAMDSITKEGCKLVLNEVYEGDVEGFITRGDQFFAVMPDPDAEKELSEYSPLHGTADEEASGNAEQK